MKLFQDPQNGTYLAPGFIDLHVHLRDPGVTHKEDIQSGCAAARKGGFSTICCMPNTNPAVDSPEIVRYIWEKAAKEQGVRVLPIGAITKGQMGKELANIEGMAAAGICAISEDGKSVGNADLMLTAMKKAAALNLPVFSHAEDLSLGDSALSEELTVARDILLAKEAGCRLHFCHISTYGSVARIRKAKAAGLSVTAETAPHYFTLSEGDVCENPNRKMNPPLRTLEDVKAVREGLADGTIDAIATDHAPHAPGEKAVPFADAPNGVVGLETCFAVSYTVLVKGGILTLEQLLDKLCSGPARILDLKDENVFLPAVRLDLETEYEIGEKDLAGKSVNSPFLGMRVFGKVMPLEGAGK